MVGLVAYPCVYNLLIKAVAPFPLRVFDFGADLDYGLGLEGGYDAPLCFAVNFAAKPIKAVALD